MTSNQIISDLKKNRNQHNIDGMARFGINPDSALGISIPHLRKTAKQIGKDHKLALELWNCGIHEARILATLIDDPTEVSESQMNKWVKDFNSWDLCDQCCSNLFGKTPFAIEKSIEWAERDEEFVKRAGFVIMAVLSVHNKKMSDDEFITFFPIIEQHSEDDRNFVKKAVNWALRQIGKRNENLNKDAVLLCKKIMTANSKAAKWIANDALRELTSDKIVTRLKEKKEKLK